MRKDVTIVVVAAGILVAVFVGWIIIDRASHPKDTTPTDDAIAKKEQTNVPMPPLLSQSTTPPGAPGDTLAPPYGDPPPPTDRTTAPPAGTGTAAGDTASRHTEGEWWREPSTGTERTSTGPPGPVAAGAEQTYVIKHGDTYSALAKEHYGKASLWKVIADANPNVPDTLMIPGKTIRIPPRPTQSAPSATAGAADTTGLKHGSTGVDPVTGKRFYIVSNDDSHGFWGIAKKLYAHGKHNALLEKANPDVNSNKLRAGQKIWAPKRTGQTDVATASPPSGTQPPVRPSQRRAFTGRVLTGAPVRTVLPDGRVFD